MADPAQEIARYKALLVKAKGAIDVQRQQVTEKQREIERLNEELREAQARAAADQDSAQLFAATSHGAREGRYLIAQGCIINHYMGMCGGVHDGGA